MPTFEEHVDAIETEHNTVTAERDAAVSAKVTLEQTVSTLEARIAELQKPVPATPTGTKPPAIIDERFKNGVDWSRFFSDAGGGPSAPRDRFMPTPEGLKIIWLAGSPTGTKRTELGIRAVQGGDDTPRRDPIGSERYYGMEFFIPEAYKLDLFPDEKRVLWQCHQSGPGINNPPLSLELRNGTLRLVRSVGDVREHLLNPNATPYPGIPCAKNVWHKLLVHTHWHAVSGFVECWLDALHVPKLVRNTCSAVTDGMQVKEGSYQPGYASFTSGARLEHLLRRFSVGDHTNTPGDFA